MKVLGLHGRMGSGKNFIADKIANSRFLAAPDHACMTTSIAVADPMKEAIVILFGIPREDLHSQEGKAKFTDWYWEDLGALREQFADRSGPMTVRDIMQCFGTETMRRLWGGNFWARLLQKTLKRLESEKAWSLVIVTDVRYPEEADVVHSFGGEIWKIVPVEMPLAKILSGETVKVHQEEHSSEQVFHKTLIDATVYNSFRDFAGTEAAIRPLLADLMDEFPWREGKGAYENNGPEEEIAFEKAGHRFLVSPTGDCGFDTGRKKYLVKCLSCEKLLHENTTGPGNYITRHLEAKRP